MMIIALNLMNHLRNFLNRRTDQASNSLRDMVIASGDFQGIIVGDFLDIASKVLGGTSTDYTPAQVNGAADNINKYYGNGTNDLGFLTCPN